VAAGADILSVEPVEGDLRALYRRIVRGETGNGGKDGQ